MAITGIDTIDGKQIIAAGAVSAKSAEMAYNDENGNPITGYLTAVPEGYATTGDLTAYQLTADMTAYQSAGDYLTTADSGNFLTAVPDTYLQNTDLTITDGKVTEISGVPLSAGSAPTYGYTDNGLISAIDTSGLYAVSATSALIAATAKHLNQNGTMGKNVIQSDGSNNFCYMPTASPFGKPTGIFSPLQYATGACLAMDGGNYNAYFKGNEWYVSNSAIGQMLRGEVHRTRGVHISGATTAGYDFNLGIDSVSGINSTGSWKYGHAEDAALRAVSSCDMHESAFEYDANDKISGYNGSAFAGGSDVPEGVMVESGLEYNAVNEISAYNGSAIAQYGAEKQWIVVDDTLLTLSNSAQFALGVNISAVAQLLGVDETVLWSGSITWGQTAALSDSVKNYDRIRFYIEETNRHRKSTNELVLTDLSNANLREFALNMQDATTSYFGNYFTVYNVNEAGDSLTSVSGRQWWYSPWTAAGINGSPDRGLILTRVVGIGRKA